MTVTLFAQPYDISASGFYFKDVESYLAKAAEARNDYGDPVEEFEIQFIDGEDLDARLFEHLGIHQGDLKRFFEVVQDWSDDQKTMAIIAAYDNWSSFDYRIENPYDLELHLYQVDNLRELAEQFVDEGLFGEIPDHLSAYIDYDAIARDLAMDHHETDVTGTCLIYSWG